MISSSIIKGKNCFISGATGGLGKSIATELVLNQCNLFLTSTNKTNLIFFAGPKKLINIV